MTDWEPMNSEVKDRLERLFDGGSLTDLMIRKTDQMVIPESLERMLPTIKELEVREDDILVVSYPKCGTTLTMEMAWLISHQADTETAKATRGGRCSFVEGPAILGQSDWTDYYQNLSNISSPRVFNTHLRPDMLPCEILKKSKIIFVCREVKDTIVSYYHHNRLLKCHNYVGDFKTFSEMFMKSELPYGSFWQSFSAWWSLRNFPNVHMIWYEDIVKDRTGTIRNLADFLGYRLTDKQVETLSDFVKFDNYKTVCQLGNKESWNVGEGEFVRKGEVGNWRDYMMEGDEIDNWSKSQLDIIGVQDTNVRQRFGV